MTNALKPCPICGIEPDRFIVSDRRIEVIACRKGCKPHMFAFVVHITSEQIKGLGWTDLGDAWNTIHLWHDADGKRRVSFNAYPAGKEPVVPEGPFMKWSPAISAQKAAEAKATGVQS